jgi:hypothetical protein
VQERLGVIHGGRRKPTGYIDIALMQSLVRRGAVANLVTGYGHLVVDECHHLSAVSFDERMDIIRSSSCNAARSVIASMPGSKPLLHKVVFRRTGFRLARNNPGERPAIQELSANLAREPVRNDLVFDDILSALEAGRPPVVITERILTSKTDAREDGC